MSRQHECSRILPLIAAGLLLGLPAGAAAGPYPGNKCVSGKLKAAADRCDKALKAWSIWDKTQNDGQRDTLLAKSGTKFDKKWAKAEERAARKSVDCADTTAPGEDMKALIDAGVGDIATQINDGLDLVGSKNHRKCGGKLLKLAATACQKLLKAESKYIKKLSKDPDGTKRDEEQAKALDQLADKWAKTILKGQGDCPTAATAEGIEALVDGLGDDVVSSSIVSPNVDDTQFTTYSPTGPIPYQGRNLTPTCVFDTPYHFFAKRGSVNKLVMYYQGGGACWEQLTCMVPTCDTEVNPFGGDNPNGSTTGFADLSNPDNPFKDWNIVFVSYCSCDIHFGDAAQDYDNVIPAAPLHVEHRGFQNARVVEKWAREHFVDPEVVFVTGSSAGAYGALFNAPLLEEVWPASRFHVLGDAGNGVITTQFLQNEFGNWNFLDNLPADIPGVRESITDGTGMVGYIDAVAHYFAETNWAHYSTAFDGGSGGQTGFYNVMLNGSDPGAALTWWEGSCPFNQVLRQQAFDTAVLAPDNYRYYIGSGSRHTMYGNDKVYTDTLGGVPPVVDWVNAMLAGAPGAPDPGWTSVEASPFNVLLPGDPKPPVIPTPPFEASGPDIVVSCGP